MEGKSAHPVQLYLLFPSFIMSPRKREWPVRGRNTTWKQYAQVASHAAEPTDAPGVKFRPRETIFFPRTGNSGRTHKTWRDWHAEGSRTVAWRSEESVEEIEEKTFHIDIWVLHGKLDTGCVHIFWNHRDREVSVTDTFSILIEGMSINEIDHWELSAFFIPTNCQFCNKFINLIHSTVSLNILWLSVCV